MDRDLNNIAFLGGYYVLYNISNKTFGVTGTQ